MPFDITMPIQFHGILSTIGWFDVLDIIIVAVILYKIYEIGRASCRERVCQYV